MSTISIMPLGSKVRITRRAEVLHSQLLAGSDRLKDAGYILGKFLLLEEGCHVRFEGFKAFATNKSYPDVKVTVYPIEGKSAALYVSMENLDGLSWEPAKEDLKEEKKAAPPSRRYDVDLIRNEIDVRWVYHNAFESLYDCDNDVFVLVNPICLSTDERSKGFCKINLIDIGEAMLTEPDRSKHRYCIRVKTIHYFTTTLNEEGLLSARCTGYTATLLVHPYHKDLTHSVEVCDLILGETDVAAEVKAWMKKQQHKYEKITRSKHSLEATVQDPNHRKNLLPGYGFFHACSS